MTYIAYFAGGSMDLTKKVYEGVPEREIRVYTQPKKYIYNEGIFFKKERETQRIYCEVYGAVGHGGIRDEVIFYKFLGNEDERTLTMTEE